VLLAALVLIGGGGGAWTWARVDLRRREMAVGALKARYQSMGAEYADVLRTRARAEHLEEWMSTRVEWLSHLEELSGKLPGPRAGLLDRLEARDVTVGLTPGGSTGSRTALVEEGRGGVRAGGNGEAPRHR
jgi:hypothetical protein